MMTLPQQPRFLLACSLLALFVQGAPAPADQKECSWLGSSGAWSDPTKWDMGLAPDNSGTLSFLVRIDNSLPAASDVYLDESATIDLLYIDPGDVLRIVDGGLLTFEMTQGESAIKNSGLLRMEATAGMSGLHVLDGDLILTGEGAVSLSDSPNNAITGSGTAPRLINDGHAISGAGRLGDNSLAIVNQGTISATEPTPLVIDPNASGTVNIGLLQARPGSVLSLTGGDIVNTDGATEGTILADGGRVEIIGTPADRSVVTGGEIRVEGAGELTLAYADLNDGTVENSSEGTIRVSTFSSIKGQLNNPVGGQIVIENNISLTFSSTGIYVNDGEIYVGQYGLSTNGATVEGSGKIFLTSTSSQIGGGIVNEGNTIEGAGSIWPGIFGITNRAIVRANSPGLNLMVQSGGTVNSGVMEAVGGGTLHLWPGFPGLTNYEDDGAGVIRAGDGGNVITAEINGGIVEALSGGTIDARGTFSGVDVRVHSGGVLKVNTLWGTTDATQVTIDTGGRMEVTENAAWTTYGPATHVNNGVIKLGSPTTRGSLILNEGESVISGNGEIDMTAHANNSIRTFSFSVVPPILTIGENQLLHGCGTIGTPSPNFGLLNYGTIDADQDAPLILRANTLVPPLRYFDNYGEITVSGSGGLTLSGQLFRSWGNITIPPSRGLTLSGVLFLYEGSMLVEGTVTNSAPDSSPRLVLYGGTLSGSGTVQAITENSSAVEPGSPVGLLSFTRDFRHTATGELSIEIGGLMVGTEYDRLAVGGVATLDGTLRIEFVNGYEPNVGDTFTVMTYPSKVGDFVNTIVPSLPGKVVEVAVGAMEVIVSVAAAPVVVNRGLIVNPLEAFIATFSP